MKSERHAKAVRFSYLCGRLPHTHYLAIRHMRSKLHSLQVSFSYEGWALPIKT